MVNILEEIVAHKRLELEKKLRTTHPDEIERLFKQPKINQSIFKKALVSAVR